MLTHIDLHYLAAILTQIGSRWGVEIELGEMVEDVAAGKGRDVDITVRYRLQNGALAEMHGIEVKDEERPLDLVHVEQIIAKLKDMPSLTKHALVSSNGFTGAAKKKALYHGLDLYHLLDWDGAGLRVDMSHLNFGGVTTLKWESFNPKPIIQGPLPEGTHVEQSFEFGADLMICDPSNPDLKRGFGELLDSVGDIVLNDLNDQIRQHPALAKEKRFIVNTPVNFQVPFQISINGTTVTIPTIQIEGVAILEEYPAEYALKALKRDEDNSPVAGCMINELPDGSLSVLMASGIEGSLTARFISVSDRGKKKIYKEKMTPIPPEGPPSVDVASANQ